MDDVDPVNAAEHGRDPLDRALSRALASPAVPDGFAVRLGAAMAREAARPRQADNEKGKVHAPDGSAFLRYGKGFNTRSRSVPHPTSARCR